MNPTDRIYPDTVLHLNGHRVVIPAELDPVRQVLLGDLDEVEEFEPLEHERNKRDHGGTADAKFAPSRPATASGNTAHGNGERRSRGSAGADNGASSVDAQNSNETDASDVAGNGSVAPGVAPECMENTNDPNDVTQVADRGPDGPEPQHPAPSPDPEPALAGLLDEVVSVIRSFVYLLPDQLYAEATALWIVGTHVFEWSNTFPRFVATSPEPGCGKSKLLTVMRFLCPNSSFHARATEPAILRRTKRLQDQKITPTIFLDDAESFVDGSHTSLLNAGFDRFGGTIIRCRSTKAGNYTDEEFNVYVPVAIGRIGKVPVDSTRTRCLEVNVQRAKPSEVLQKLGQGTAASLVPLSDRLSQWAAREGAALKNYDPELPPQLANRDADIWRFLIAVADMAGRRWSKLARACALAITRNASVQNPHQNLRTALRRSLFVVRDNAWLAKRNLSLDKLGAYETASGMLRISSDGLCQLLRAVDDRQNKVNPTKLADQLRPFDVRPGSIYVGEGRLRGYKEEDLIDMLDRYESGGTDDIQPV